MKLAIKGHDIHFSFGLYSIGKVLKKYDVELMDFLNLLQKNPLTEFIDVIYFFIECEFELDGVANPIKKRDLIELLESTNDFNKKDGILATFNKGLIESLTGHFLPTPEADSENDSSEVKKK